MKPVLRRKAATKVSTGIAGLDEMTDGGLPKGQMTLLLGGPGCGKTIMSLQFLAHGAHECNEAGIFVAFEEHSTRITANAESFGWRLPELCRRKKLFFVDAQPTPDLIQSGSFDINGLLAAVEAQAAAMNAKRIVFDALDIILALLPDSAARRREVYRLHEWLIGRGFSGVLTSKIGPHEIPAAIDDDPSSFMQFMVDCVVSLHHRVDAGISHRSLRVQKYRGSVFDENEAPARIGATGLEVFTPPAPNRRFAEITGERISSGVPGLDAVLGGGYLRGHSVLLAGLPGTAKTTLSGAFAAAACARGEKTLFVCFESNTNEVIRNLETVGIGLGAYVKDGRLRMASARGFSGSAQTYLTRVESLAKEHGARCVVIDPMATWSQSDLDSGTHSVAEWLTDWTKGQGISLVCTSLGDEISAKDDVGSPLQISTLVDTWIHLTYQLRGGERHRAISVIKSRGTAHSSQVRELIIGKSGVTLGEFATREKPYQRPQSEVAPREPNAISDEHEHAARRASESPAKAAMAIRAGERLGARTKSAASNRSTSSGRGNTPRDPRARKPNSEGA